VVLLSFAPKSPSMCKTKFQGIKFSCLRTLSIKTSFY
jgi:hypothetical protein